MHKPMTDTELDALIVRALSRLPSCAPTPRFASNVMARVELPQPRLLVLGRRAVSWVREPRRALAFAGVYAVAAGLALVVAVPWLFANFPALQLGLDWAMTQTATLMRNTSLSAASWWVSSGIADATRVVPRSGPALWLSIGTLAAGYAGAAFGLHVLLRAPRVTDAPVHASA